MTRYEWFWNIKRVREGDNAVERGGLRHHRLATSIQCVCE